jgi:enoyl-CoA hydratase/carnithine racemase
MPQSSDVVRSSAGAVAIIEIRRPPHNFFDLTLVRDLADAFEAVDAAPELRAIVLASEGKSFCAGADFSGNEGADGSDPMQLYREALRLFATRKPIVAAIQGAAIGGGLGLALCADFRVAAFEARFAANFVKLNLHAGFGLTHTLPRLVGQQRAAHLLYSGRRVSGDEALAMGLADAVTRIETLRETAIGFAAEIAENAPLAVEATRATLRDGLAKAVAAQVEHEAAIQRQLFATRDYEEGVAAVRERRPGRWVRG